MTKQILFGGISLNDHLSGPINYSESLNRKKKLKEQIWEIKRYGILSSEKESLEELYNLKAQTAVNHLYQQLNPEFLSMSNKIIHKGMKINAPKFSVYPVFGDSEMRIKIYKSNDYSVDIGLPLIFRKPMLKATTIEPESELVEWLDEHHNSVLYLNSYLNGFVPIETKKNIKKAEREFGSNGLYFVAETKPESWNMRELTKDPLVVGILENRCYLVDKFNTTSLEDYVAREFSS